MSVTNFNNGLREARREEWILRSARIVYCGRHMHLQTIHVLGQIDLAAKTRCVCQIVGQVQHIELLVSRLIGQFLIVVGLEDQMASGAGQCALAGAESIQVNVVVHDNVQQGIAHLAASLDSLAARPDKG